MYEKYANGRRVIRKGGRYAKPPTLAEQGYPIADGKLKTCAKCGEQSRQILSVGWRCACGHVN